MRPRFSNSSWENYKIINENQKKIVKYLKEYVEDFSNRKESGIIILGNPGTGKTHLCSVIEKKIQNCVMVKAYDLFRQVKSTWKKEAEESENEVIKSFRRASLLIVDDIGLQFVTNAEKIILYEILDYRYDYLRPTILTSNCDLKTFENIVGNRIISRLSDGNGKILVFDWSDFRVSGDSYNGLRNA